MMQIDELVVFNRHGARRSIGLRAGRLNVITGDSLTGKSSLINIVRFLLGSRNPHVPRGPISSSVAWYALLGHVEDTRFVIARPAPEGDAETNEAMLMIGAEGVPAFEDLASNTSRVALREYLGGLHGLEDNLNVPPLGQTRDPLAATFVHSLFYCFQGQGEIANPSILFHRQSEEWRAQAIRDTLPYFLGAQGAEDLRRRELLTQQRRELRRVQQRLRTAESERDAGLDRAGSLLTEAHEVGLLPDRADVTDLAEARALLRTVLDQAASSDPPPVPAGDEFDRLRHRRADVTDALRDIADQLRSLDDFAAVEDAYVGELAEQDARLASIGLMPDEDGDAACPVCGRPIEEHDGDQRAAIERAFERAERRLDLARRDRPRVEAAREELRGRRAELQQELGAVDEALSALATQDELVARQGEQVNLQSYVRGRIAQYLDTVQDIDDPELEQLSAEIARLEAEVAELTEQLDPTAVRSRTDSLLRLVSRQMTEWARVLELEHSEHGAQIDLDRLTIVADTPEGPAYMDRGEIGSGMNWVGYHLTAYLALQDFFIRHSRPVPSFLILDQPSQAFFPPDREAGGDLEELSDTDRENTRRLYRLIHDVVRELDGKLQVIALDHADFEDDWFADSVEHRWREGEALIPSDWVEAR